MGGATVDAREPTTGRAMEAMAADGPEQSPPSPNRCWMEWSWKQGSESRTEAARDILGGGGHIYETFSVQGLDTMKASVTVLHMGTQRLQG